MTVPADPIIPAIDVDDDLAVAFVPPMPAIAVTESLDSDDSWRATLYDCLAVSAMTTAIDLAMRQNPSARS